MLRDLFTGSKASSETAPRRCAAARSNTLVRPRLAATPDAAGWPVRNPGGTAVNGALWTRSAPAS
jgi:hypothetical protein